MHKILIIDDEAAIRRLLRVILDGAGYQTLVAEDAASGLHVLAMERPDLLVLDLAMPGIDGFEVLRRLREWTRLPVLVLSAKPDPADKVSALDLGADDYLTKPFDAAELLARLRALLRRQADAGDGSPVFTSGDLTVDLAAHQARVGESPVALTPIEFALLAQFAKHPGRVLTHSFLLGTVWGPNAAAQSHYLRVHLTHLRRKLKAAGMAGDPIRNEPGIGYRFES